MNRLSLVFFVLLISVVACSDQQQQLDTPENLIPKKKMIDVMVEMQILEAKIVESRLQKDKALAAFNKAQKKLLASFEVDSTQYYTSDHYYMQDVATYQQLISAMTDTIDQMRNRLTESQ